jgi:transcriptional regulator with GAF, ATPase, and Fis domain
VVYLRSAVAEVDEGLLESLSALSRLLESPEDVYAGLARLAQRAVTGCDHASVSLLENGVVTTAGASDDRTTRLDDAQYRAEEGPCLSAILGETTITVEDFAADVRFPVFGPAAIAEGVASCLSLPVALGGETIGGLNLYGAARHAYSELSALEGEEVAEQVRRLMASTRAYDRSLRLVDQVQVAMSSRSEIEQAKGILMARYGIDAERAFEKLREHSQNHGRKLVDVATAIVDSHLLLLPTLQEPTSRPAGSHGRSMNGDAGIGMIGRRVGDPD